MRNLIAREGLLYGITPLIIGIILFLIGYLITGIVCVILSALVFLFFRYPDRSVKGDGGPNLIYTPADGRVICIKDEEESDYLKSSVYRISIFMSVFNVHINYAPIDGTVEYIKYTRGKFVKADIIGLKENNENNYIVISNNNIKIGVRQVAGWIARRIVCNCKKGDVLSAGQRFGLIQFGSRVDVFLPKDFNVCVKVGETVRAGRTVLGRRE